MSVTSSEEFFLYGNPKPSVGKSLVADICTKRAGHGERNAGSGAAGFYMAVCAKDLIYGLRESF